MVSVTDVLEHRKMRIIILSSETNLCHLCSPHHETWAFLTESVCEARLLCTSLLLTTKLEYAFVHQVYSLTSDSQNLV